MKAAFTRWLTEHRFAVSQMFTRMRHQPLSLLFNIVVVGIALSLPLLGYVLLTSLQPVMGRLASQPEISVFLNPAASRAEAEALGPKLQALPGVAAASFVSREQALTRMKEQAGGNELIAVLNQNPLPDTWVLHIAPDVAASEQETLAASMRTLPQVDQVQVDSAWLRRMEALVRFLRLGLGLVAAALSAAVVTVIFNTIRLQVLTQRDEIELSLLVGATRTYVRRPFTYLGTLQGLCGGLLALLLAALALWPLNQAVGDFARLYTSDFRFHLPAAGVCLLFLLLAAGLGWAAAQLAAQMSAGRTLNS